MYIAAVGTALPPHFYDQDTLIDAFEELWSKEHHNAGRVRRLHQAVQVGGRHLALPRERYAALRGFGDANDAFLEVGTEIGQQALERALEASGLVPTDIDAIWTASVTGIGTPSIDARLFHRMGLRPDIKRTPIFGLGCVAGAAGLSRVFDYLKAWPDQIAVLLSVELCSLTLQREDLSVANLISSGLFGDGSAAVVCIGEERAQRMGLTHKPRVVATTSRLYPDSERVMGWDIGDKGFRVVLDKSVPQVVRTYLREDADAFLATQGQTVHDIGTWVCHPGGPAVLKAFEDVLELPDDALKVTWDSLRDVGNLSSASVLFVLADTMAHHAPPRGTPGMLLAMGPGFCSELVAMQW